MDTDLGSNTSPTVPPTPIKTQIFLTLQRIRYLTHLPYTQMGRPGTAIRPTLDSTSSRQSFHPHHHPPSLYDPSPQSWPERSPENKQEAS